MERQHAELQIEVDKTGKIVDAKFKTCGSAIAASSFATELILGKNINDCLTIKNSDIASHLNFPPVKLHCSMLAIKSAVANFKSKNPDK